MHSLHLKLIVSFVFFLYSITLMSAQDSTTTSATKWIASVDGGYAITNKSEMTGYGLNFNIGRYIGKRFIIEAGYQHHDLESNLLNYTAQAVMNSGHLLLTFELIKSKSFSFDISPMGFYRSRDQYYDVAEGYSVNSEGYFIDENKSEKYNIQEYGYGGRASIKYKFYKEVGIKVDANYQRDLNDIELSYYSLGLFARF